MLKTAAQPSTLYATCFWFALPAAVKARAPKARLHGSRQGKPHPRKPVPVCLQSLCQFNPSCHSTLQKPTKCRCKNLQNHSAKTYIFILQLSAKRGCKKHFTICPLAGEIASESLAVAKILLLSSIASISINLYLIGLPLIICTSASFLSKPI